MLLLASTTRERDRIHARAFKVLCVVIMLMLVINGCQSSGANILTGIGEREIRSALDRGDRIIAAGNSDGAARVYQDALNKHPQHPVLSGRLGGIYFQRGDYERAAGYYRAALKSDPNCFHYALTLAQCQGRLAATSIDRDNKMEAAARAFQFAQTLDPQNLTATIELAMCYREIGEYDKALEILKDAANEHPNAAIIHTQVGEIYHSQNDLDRALEEFNLALACDGRNLAAHNGCAMVDAARAREGGAKSSIARERAIAHLRRSLQINPHQPEIRGMLDRLEPYQWRAVTVTEESAQ